jgi:excinuclease ABC subunit C
MEKEKIYKNLPDTPGVYLMKDGRGRILYIGKAGNLRRRVASYFLRPHDSRIEKLVLEIGKIDYRKTDTALEALILEASLIKKYLPPYNIREKDDKSFLYVEITKEKFPRVLLARGRERSQRTPSGAGEHYGPFVSASNVREALRIIRRIFPFSVHPSTSLRASPSGGKRPCPESHRKGCFDYEIGLCPGTCIGAVERDEYLKNIRNIKLLFRGKKKTILKDLNKDMKAASGKLEFEKAAKIRRQIFALQHVQDVALISDEEIRNSKFEIRNSAQRIEGYDISNISGDAAVGAMVVFLGGKPDKSGYRVFKIRTIKKSDDVGMLKETLCRRLNHSEWPLPDVILIDGGKGQVNGVRQVLDEFGLKLPVVGIAKGAKRKKNEFIGSIPYNLSPVTLVRVRDEAHRFAKNRHEELRNRSFL